MRTTSPSGCPQTESGQCRVNVVSAYAKSCNPSWVWHELGHLSGTEPQKHRLGIKPAILCIAAQCFQAAAGRPPVWELGVHHVPEWKKVTPKNYINLVCMQQHIGGQVMFFKQSFNKGPKECAPEMLKGPCYVPQITEKWLRIFLLLKLE